MVRCACGAMGTLKLCLPFPSVPTGDEGTHGFLPGAPAATVPLPAVRSPAWADAVGRAGQRPADAPRNCALRAARETHFSTVLLTELRTRKSALYLPCCPWEKSFQNPELLTNE